MATPRSIALALLLAMPLVVLCPAHAAETNLPNSEYRPLRLPRPAPPPIPAEVTFSQPPGLPNAQGELTSPRRQRPDAAELEIQSSNSLARASQSPHMTGILKLMSSSIERYKWELSDTNLESYRRSYLERLLANEMQRYADASTNAQLWANLNNAQLSRDPDKVAAAKAHLMEYLAPKLERKTGKKYSPTMSFEEFTAEWKAASPPPDSRAPEPGSGALKR